jgi:hypothetical protein
VERITGRVVRSFLSGVDTLVEGMSTEVFVLWPLGAEGPSRVELDFSSRGARAPSKPDVTG